MPALTLASTNQLFATSGRMPRVRLAEALREEAPSVYTTRAFEQSQEQLRQQEQALNLQAAAQASQRTQGTVGSVISGAGTLGQGYMAAKSLGLIGGTTATDAGAAVPAIAAAGTPSTVTGTTTGLTAGGTAGEFAAAGAPATAAAAETGADVAAGVAGASGAGAPAAAGIGLGTVATGAGIAGLGLGAGSLVGRPVKRAAGGGFKGAVAGHAAGAATGAALGAAAGTFVFPGIGTAAGAVIGAIGGGLGASFCVLHEAGYGRDSREVAIVRLFRDRHLTTAQRRAYYARYEAVAARMRTDDGYRQHVRYHLTDRLVRYGAATLGIPYARPSAEDRRVAQAFLRQLTIEGQGIGPVTRRTGEVV